MNLKRKSESQFTMIQRNNDTVVVIVAILAVIALPTYLTYVESGYASEARTVMSNINNASKMYYQTRENILKLDDEKCRPFLKTLVDSTKQVVLM